jgi:hypothetical protein
MRRPKGAGQSPLAATSCLVGKLSEGSATGWPSQDREVLERNREDQASEIQHDQDGEQGDANRLVTVGLEDKTSGRRPRRSSRPRCGCRTPVGSAVGHAMRWGYAALVMALPAAAEERLALGRTLVTGPPGLPMTLTTNPLEGVPLVPQFSIAPRPFRQGPQL